jgi:hypothetical protein
MYSLAYSTQCTPWCVPLIVVIAVYVISIIQLLFFNEKNRDRIVRNDKILRNTVATLISTSIVWFLCAACSNENIAYMFTLLLAIVLMR